jgi:hypothetical protein
VMTTTTTARRTTAAGPTCSISSTDGKVATQR